ncbi:hypothetical protein PULV_a2393 [Pseudoalteromonas ulvae UL12]|nr:hypothetical protein [Pseudoalteromonas ulvae UL12]
MKFYLSLFVSFLLGVGTCYSYFLITSTHQHLTVTPNNSVMIKDASFDSPLSARQSAMTSSQPSNLKTNNALDDKKKLSEQADEEYSEALPDQSGRDQATLALDELPNFSALDSHFQSVEFAKAAAMIEVNFAINEISTALGLNAQQLTELRTLLHEKNNAEIELMTPYYQRMALDNNPFVSPEQDQAEIEAINIERAAIQQRFEQHIVQHLTSQQLESYHQLEKQKILQQHELDKFYSTQSYFAMLPNLQDSQKQVILDIYQQSYQQSISNIDVKLGAFGTAHRQFYQNEHPMQAVEAQIDQILTPEQLATKQQFERLESGE